MLRHIMDSQQKLDKYLEQLYTGRKINYPSDDPVIAMKGIAYRTEVMEVEQYKRNASEVKTWMDNSDAALDKATQAMHRLYELAVQASNSTNDTDELNSIKKEVEQLRDHLVDIANTNVSGKYIFNGKDTKNPPITVTEDGDIITNNINNEPVEIEVFKGTLVQANVSAKDLFHSDDDDGLFQVINNFIEVLGEENPTSEGFNEAIEQLNKNTSKILDARASLGARMNRLELIDNRLDEQEVIAKQVMAENENVHFEEAITQLITQETLHRAALAAGSRMMQPTLIDFLR